jgi:hypothetical protein
MSPRNQFTNNKYKIKIIIEFNQCINNPFMKLFIDFKECIVLDYVPYLWIILYVRPIK